MTQPIPPLDELPGVDWVDRVDTDPVGALESFALGWFPAGSRRRMDPVPARPPRADGPLGDRLVLAAWNGASSLYDFPWSRFDGRDERLSPRTSRAAPPPT
ncbi:hypothetical protein ACFVQ4_04555 [Streptomyces laurentii]|uniref:hypothetical protein n=1 Tax=Streptomyces laurentii TaxID=39478 RepID=UPI0036A64396